MKEYLDAQAAKTAIPTPAQAEAGNYRKGRVKAHGLPIVIETARGSMRRGIGHDGKPWAVRSPAHYGYISRTEGADGDHVDVYIGPHLKSKKVYVLDQLHADSGRFDEHKVFLGFASPRQVLAMYRKAFSDGKADARFGELMEMSPEQFRGWLAKDDTTKPIHRADGGRVNYADGGDIANGMFGAARDYMLETGDERPELFDPYAQETAAYLRENNGTWGQRARKAASDFGGYLWDAGKNIASAPVKIAADPSSVAPFVGRLTGTMGYEREQTWPEKMIRSGATLPGDVYAGREQMWDPETNHTSDRIIERTQDLAGLAGGSSFAAPAEEASLRSGVSRPVRAARESLHDTADANFIYGSVGKNETVPIDSLNSGYLSKSPLDHARVADLKNSISGPDGYIERLIVDGQGNVIEGQHRLAAIRELGIDRVPISRIHDLAEGFNISTIEDAVRAAGVGHGDQVHGVVKGALEAAREYGSPQKALTETEMPGAWQKPYEAALRAMAVSSDSGKPGAAVAGLRRSALPMDEASRMARAAEQGYEGPWYHGSERTDRLTEKGKIDPRRATSGPMAFFTDNPEVASNYAKSKADTSLNYNLDVGVDDYFHVSPKQLGISGRAPLTVEQSWHYLPRAVQQDILSKAKRVGHENPDTASGPYTLHDYDATLSPDHFDYLMKTSARGNPLKALREMWHDGGELVGNETALTDIYRLAGYPYQISETAAPWTQANGVMPARIRMQNPLHTDKQQLMIETVLPRLEEMFKRDRSRKKEFGADDWDKNTRWTPREWIQQAKEDYAKGDNSFVWTSIPDKITSALRSMGYDGVVDTGGKMGGAGHRVAVPFGPEQVRSQFARFDPKDLGKSGLLLSDSGQPGSAIAATANADGKITRLPSPQSLQALPHPSLQNMKDFSRVESVPLSDVRTMQDGRGGMNWEANKRGEYAAPLMKDYADKPVAVRKETGEYVIIDGNHRTVNAINRGDKSLEMHVIDAKKYAPHAAGIKPSRSGAKWGKDDDEILRELGAGTTNRARGGAVEHMADGGVPGGDGWVDVPSSSGGDWVDVPNPSPKVGTGKAALEGYLSGASANFRDEVYGASEASGLPPVLGGFRAPVGAARIGLESMWPETFGTSATDAYTKARDETRVIQKAAKEQHPYAYGAGEIGGALMPMVALPGAGPAASATTMSTRALRGAQIGAEYGALAGAGEGESASERITGAGVGALAGGVGGAAAPVAGKAAEIVYDRFGRPIVGAIRGMVNWEAEAARRVTTALQRDAVDIAAGRAKGMLPQDWAAARAAGEPVTIADLGAGNTQALLRSAANTSPEGRAALEKVINDRFAGQSQRVADDVRGLVAGGANAGKTADQLVAEYDVARAPAYRAAFNHPKAQSMWDNEFAQMAQAPAVQEAIRMATINARDEAAKLGLKPPVNPFQFGKDGTVSLTDPNFRPNLQFWDVVKKNLDSGDRLSQQWAKVLRNKLDGYGTGYDRARGIAATFFGERDALAAGRSLAGKKIAPDELEMIMRKMNPQERDLFREGYASDWADRVISNMSDTRDVTKAMFNSPAQRKVAQIVFGPAGMAKIEARMVIESIMDGARRSMGNSTTARQLIEAGLAGGALGGLESGWDPYHMAAGAATAAGARKVIGAEIAAGARKLVGRVDSNTARRVAELLTSNDPAQLQKGLALAVSNKRIGDGLRSIASRLALSGTFQAPVPHRLTAPFGMTGSAPAAAQGNQE